MTDTQDATLVDPRDIGWEVDHPRFRVYIWNAPRSSCREWELDATVADVREAVSWAVRHRAPGETAEVHAVVDGDGLGLITLARITDETPAETV